MPSGLRVNCTLAESASSSRSRLMAALIASAANTPGKPTNAATAPATAASAPAPCSSRLTPRFALLLAAYAAIRPGRAIHELLAALPEPAQAGEDAGHAHVERHVAV